MKTGIAIIVCAAIITGGIAGYHLTAMVDSVSAGRNQEMAGPGKKKAVGYGVQNGSGHNVGYVDADGDAQPDPNGTGRQKLAQSLSTALTGGYNADDYATENYQSAQPSFDYSKQAVQKPAKRSAWGDSQKPSAKNDDGEFHQKVSDMTDDQKVKAAQAEVAAMKTEFGDEAASAGKLQYMKDAIQSKYGSKVRDAVFNGN